MKKIVIAGGTGFIGAYISQRFREKGYFVKIISRGENYVPWIEKKMVNVLEEAELVINLAGKTINCRYTEQNKKAIIDSRVTSTSMIGKAISLCEIPPKLWINASATGIYNSAILKPANEDEKILGDNFLADVVRSWEQALFNFKFPKTRQIALRTSVVLGKNGGALKPLSLLTKLRLGGMQGDGKQMMSWIHIEDYFRILLYAMENESFTGIVNATSPEPISNKLFMSTMRKILHIRHGLNAPEFAIRLSAKFIGIEPELILNSSWVEPKRLIDAGFIFTFPKLSLALDDLFY
jgi:uncharacterized protein (TIGR01777 family)